MTSISGVSYKGTLGQVSCPLLGYLINIKSLDWGLG